MKDLLRAVNIKKQKMDKLIKKLFRNLKIEFYCLWAVCIILYLIGKYYDNPLAGLIMPKSQGEYILQIVCAVGVLAGIPLALKLFTLNTTKNLRRMNFDEALTSYHIWSLVRMGILLSVALLGIFVYFAASNVSCGICTLMALTATFFCYPSEDKIRKFLETLNNEDN